MTRNHKGGLMNKSSVHKSSVSEADKKERKERDDIRAAFDAIDADGDGYITKDELHQLMKSIG
jgi:Ca2+-binding EF-hand superfamily protein